jgi:hypothetical protein
MSSAVSRGPATCCRRPLDAHGAVLRTVIGFVPPGELAPELMLMDALWALRRGHHDHARAAAGGPARPRRSGGDAGGPLLRGRGRLS